jgi:molecular chaperone Hsp33
MAPQPDSLHRFVFERPGVRGELVHLDAAWRAVLERHPYPEVIRRPLGEALTAVLLLTATLKFEGSLILQAQGQGPLRTLVAQATHNRTVRGLARWDDELDAQGTAATLAELFGEGRLVLTIEPKGSEPYQGIVPLQGDGIGAAVEAYFGASEQLPTRFWLAVNGQRATGLMLQRLPGPAADEDGWNRTTLLADTVAEDELLSLPAAELLKRLFHEEDVRLFEPDPVAFRCGCSRRRIADSLRAMGRREVDDILAEQGIIEVTCEFCNRDYRFDPVDAHELFADVVPAAAPGSRH